MPATTIARPALGAAQSTEDFQDVREKIATGVASLREGTGMNGDTFMSALEAELDTLGLPRHP